MIVFIVAVVFNEYLSALKECLIHIRVRWGGGGVFKPGIFRR